MPREAFPVRGRDGRGCAAFRLVRVRPHIYPPLPDPPAAPGKLSRRENARALTTAPVPDIYMQGLRAASLAAGAPLANLSAREKMLLRARAGGKKPVVPRRIIDDSSDESDAEPARPAAATKIEARSTLKDAVARTRMHRQRENKPQKEIKVAPIKVPAPIKVAFLSPDDNDQENNGDNDRQSTSPAPSLGRKLKGNKAALAAGAALASLAIPQHGRASDPGSPQTPDRPPPRSPSTPGLSTFGQRSRAAGSPVGASSPTVGSPVRPSMEPSTPVMRSTGNLFAGVDDEASPESAVRGVRGVRGESPTPLKRAPGQD